MSVTIGDSEHRILSGPGAGDVIQTFSMTVGGSAKGAVVMFTTGAVGGSERIVDVDIGGVPFTEYAYVSNGAGSERESGIWVCDDISGRANDTITVEIQNGASWWNLHVAILNADQSVAVADSGTGIGPGGTVVGITLDDGGVGSALGLACASGGGANFSSGGGQSNLWTTDFFTLMDSIGDYESFSGSHTLEFFSNSGFSMSAISLTDVFVPPDFEDPFIPTEPHLC